MTERSRQAPSTPIRVFLLDDHEVVRRGLRDLLEIEGEFEVVGEASTAAEALARVPAGGRRSGLANLRERAEQLGGAFTIGARPNGGTAAVWNVPARLDEHQDAADGTIGEPDQAEGP